MTYAPLCVRMVKLWLAGWLADSQCIETYFETCVWHSFSLYCVVCLLSIDFNSTFRRFLYSSIVSRRDDRSCCCCCCYCRRVIACGRRSNKTMMMNDLNCFGRSRCQAESALTLNVCVWVAVVCPFFFSVTLIKMNTQNDFASPWLLSPAMLSVLTSYNHYHLWVLNKATTHKCTQIRFCSRPFFSFFASLLN